MVTVHDLTAARYPELCTPTSLRYPDLVRRALARGAWVHTPSAFVATEVESTPLRERLSDAVYARIREEARVLLDYFTHAAPALLAAVGDLRDL